MKFEEPIAKVVLFENDDVITTSYYSEDEVCANTSFDAENCDGVTQAVSKGQF